MSKIILASASPRRRELLEQIGVDFGVFVTDADESKIDKNLPVNLYVEEVAMAKAAAACSSAENKIIISADTVVYHDGKILGKPKDESDAFKMLSSLSGNMHEVYTGICIMRSSDGFAVADYEKTEVYFNSLTEDEINNYIRSKEPMDKAGAYGIQGLGALLVNRINGDYFNVVGLPLSKLAEMLRKEFEIDLL